MIMTYIGIDISKDTFVAAYPSKNGYQTKTFKNSAEGIRKFIHTLNSDEHHCVMEATGNYAFLLLYLLDKARIRASLVNPKQIKHFAHMMMTVTKTDEKDAQLIAMFGDKMNPEPYKFPSESIMLLKQKRTVIRQLKKQLRATQNLQEAMNPLPSVDKSCQQALKKTVAFLEKQIKSLEGELTSLAKKEFDKQLSALTSIKGIGVTLATALIIATGGFTYFDNAKQISRFLGLCPTYQQSGTSVNIRGHINRNGDSYLRSQLYVASWSAIQYNSACKECYERLRQNGKPSKVALVAVANKLIRQAFAIVKSDSQEYIDGFVSDKPIKFA